MKMTEVHASFEKRLSNNNYGGECSRVDLVAVLEAGDDPMECADLLLTMARTRVHMDLHTSLDANIRRQVQLPTDGTRETAKMVKVRTAAQVESDLSAAAFQNLPYDEDPG